MNNDFQNTQLSLTGITGEHTLAADIFSSNPAAGLFTPPPTKGQQLPEGWHDTEKYGPVYVTPGGIAWAVQLVGNKFENVSVQLSKDDIIGKTSAEKVKDARRKQVERAKTKAGRTTPSILTASVVEGVN
jgi:hypothetical protein